MRRAGQRGVAWGRAAAGGAALVCLWVAACAPAATGGEERAVPAAPSADGVRAAGRSAPADAPLIVAFGDSLTAGLGLLSEQAYPARLQAHVDRAGHGVRIVNAGESGETTAGGRRRLEWVLDGWALDGDVRILILALGGNDGLRGLPIDQMRDNLAGMIAAARARGIRVLLAGMESPPNFGAAYTEAFRGVFAQLAAEYAEQDEHGVKFLPFLLDGVAGEPALNQADGIHPNARGAERVAAHVWSALEPMLEGIGAAVR